MKLSNLVLFFSMAISSIFSTSAFSDTHFSVERNYDVNLVKEMSENVYELKSALTADFSVYIDCNRNTFDNPKDDWVGGFSNQSECKSFIKTIKNEINKGYKVKLKHYRLDLTIVTTQ